MATPGRIVGMKMIFFWKMKPCCINQTAWSTSMPAVIAAFQRDGLGGKKDAASYDPVKNCPA